MITAYIPGYEVLIGSMLATLTLWAWWAVHCRNVIVSELSTRDRRTFPIRFFPGHSGSVRREYESSLMDVIQLYVQKILDCHTELLYANVLNTDDGKRQQLSMRTWEAEKDFHRLRRAMRWYGMSVYSDPTIYFPFELPAA